MRRVKSPVDRWRLLVSGLAGRHKRAQPLNNRGDSWRAIKGSVSSPVASKPEIDARPLYALREESENIASCWKRPLHGGEEDDALNGPCRSPFSLLEQFSAKVFHGHSGGSLFAWTTLTSIFQSKLKFLGTFIVDLSTFGNISRQFSVHPEDQPMIFPKCFIVWAWVDIFPIILFIRLIMRFTEFGSQHWKIHKIKYVKLLGEFIIRHFESKCFKFLFPRWQRESMLTTRYLNLWLVEKSLSMYSLFSSQRDIVSLFFFHFFFF